MKNSEVIYQMLTKSNPVSFYLKPRDIEIIDMLRLCRAAKTSHIFRLLFGGPSDSRCLQRLRALTQAGYIKQVQQPPLYYSSKPENVYAPTLKGIQLLAMKQDKDEIEWDGKELEVGYSFLAHILDLTEVYTGLTLATHSCGCSLDMWLNDLTLKRRHMVDRVELIGPKGAVQKATIVPDAYCVLTQGETIHRFFLELDKNTEVGQATQWGKRDIARKFLSYRYYLTRPDKDTPSLYEKRYGIDKGRVLFIAPTMRRMQRLKEICEAQGGRSKYWFTTMTEFISHNPLTDPIWLKGDNEGVFSFL